MISVVVPVGPSEANKRWLNECLQSIVGQTMQPNAVIIVDDGANLVGLDKALNGLSFIQWKSPWPLGVASAFNVGVALSPTELVFMLGSDDWLDPRCLEECYREYTEINDPLGYYFVGVRYNDGREQNLPCHAAAVTKTLWKNTGGFPLETASGAPDAAFISILMVHHNAGRLRRVADGRPLYNYRVHPDTDTASRGPWQGVILETRDLVIRLWKPR